jgi:hypothetical protein
MLILYRLSYPIVSSLVYIVSQQFGSCSCCHVIFTDFSTLYRSLVT